MQPNEQNENINIRDSSQSPADNVGGDKMDVGNLHNMRAAGIGQGSHPVNVEQTVTGDSVAAKLLESNQVIIEKLTRLEVSFENHVYTTEKEVTTDKAKLSLAIILIVVNSIITLGNSAVILLHIMGVMK